MNGKLYESWKNMPVCLTPQRQRELDDKALATLKNAKLQFPVDPYALAECMGYEVVHAYIPGNVKGWLDRDNKKIIIDEIYEKYSFEARCILMHELAHEILEHKPNEHTLNKDGQLTQEEVEADFFARAALIPWPHLERAIEIYFAEGSVARERLVDYISRVFKVTLRKAERRLKDYEELAHTRNTIIPA